MTLIWRPGYITTFADPDVQSYLTRVEEADNQGLEYPVAVAIDEFIRGCKADGIWSAIKASCIMAGARTLAGALVPLVGPAPTNIGFVAGDYNRKTGLVGGGSVKALNSNRARSADPIDSFHASLYLSTTGGNALFGLANDGQFDQMLAVNSSTGTSFRGRIVAIDNRVTGFVGASNTAAALTARANGTNSTNTGAMYGAFANSGKYYVFARNTGTGDADGVVSSGSPTFSRLAFYSIGESLNLALLDARITTLINRFAVVIP
jgi:hypothetical protein